MREVGHYVIVKEKYNSPQKFADFAREKLHLDMRAEEYVYILGLTSKNHVLGVFGLMKELNEYIKIIETTRKTIKELKK